MRRDIAAIGATLAAAGLALAGTSTVASAATPQTAQADAALRSLYTQVSADGSVSAQLGTTEDTVISVADNGYDPATLQNGASGATAYGYLSAHAAAVATAGGAAKYVLTWLAAGRPAALSATATVLLTRLNRSAAAGGFRQPNGSFHATTAAVEIANTYSQSLAVLADDAAGVALPLHATGWLTCAQRTDGGFGYAITDTTPLPPASCGDTTSDSNDTAIALQALGQTGVTSASAAAEGYLHAVQQPGGGFGFNATSSSDPDSDAVIIQALVAIGQDPTGAAWVSGGGNPLTDMETFAGAGGGYAFTHGATPDAFTTAAIPQALALKPYGTSTSIVLGSSPPPPPTPAPATPTPPASPAPVPSHGVPVPSTGSGGLAPGLLLALGGVTLAAAVLGRRPRSVL